VGREIEGGNYEMNEIQLPCVLSIQTGINDPHLHFQHLPLERTVKTQHG
jgi:electron transfer flavoprotein alpha/beta subunit